MEAMEVFILVPTMDLTDISQPPGEYFHILKGTDLQVSKLNLMRFIRPLLVTSGLVLQAEQQESEHQDWNQRVLNLLLILRECR